MSFFRQNPHFLLLWAGQVLSQSGGRMYQMAMIWWILGHVPEGPGKWIGTFMVLTALPALLLVRVIGRTVDQVFARKILVRADLAAALLVTAMAILVDKHWLSLPVALAAGFLAATLQAFLDPTLNKAIPEVVDKPGVERAVSLLTTTQSLANFTGAVAGALLIDRVGVAGTARLAAAGYVISALCSRLTQFRYPVEKGDAEEKARGGWELLGTIPILRRILVGFGLINFFSTPTLVVLPIYTKKTLGATASTLGTLEASLWVGLLGGALLAGGLSLGMSRIRLGALCLFILGLGLSVPAFITSVPVYGAALMIAGFALGVNNVKFIALFQDVVPSTWKGRFFAIFQATISFTFPLAYFLFGVLTDFLSPPQVCFIQGLGVCVLALYFLRLASEEQRGLAWQS